MGVVPHGRIEFEVFWEVLWTDTGMNDLTRTVFFFVKGFEKTVVSRLVIIITCALFPSIIVTIEVA